MQRTTSGSAVNGLYTSIKYMCGAARTGLGTTIENLRRTASGDAGSGLGTMAKYLQRITSASANNDLSIKITPLVV
jgi:hypothetical protein